MDNQAEILLVEDNQNGAKLVLRALKKNNLANNVERAFNGEEALDYIFARRSFHHTWRRI